MNTIKKFLIFSGVWLLATIILIVCFAAIFPVNENNEIEVPAIGFLIVLIVPVLCGIWANKPPRKKKAVSNSSVQAGQNKESIFEPSIQTKPIANHTLYADLSKDILYESVDTIFETGQASVSMLGRKLYINYEQAARIMDSLESLHIVSEFKGSSLRKILVTEDQANQIIQSCNIIKTPREMPAPSAPKIESISEIDKMEGHEFEHWCADLLKKNGFENVEVTKGSGDQGVDVLAAKEGIKYAIQCKCYSSDLGNKPVQEVYAGKNIYRCHVAVVMTNRYFTTGAKELAAATDVLLWDRNKLQEMLRASAAGRP